ncbi:MAG: glycosyltransferase family 2 protein [Bacteroides graminisolvens]|nr:glycosyltransferase family 2 protein [Bacteroides graminisolvens]
MIYNYSVIIPFRDCTDFLRIACASIPRREDLQIIVVDNAQHPIGADGISDFNNPNIEYYTSSPTMGAGCARNEGMKHAKGRFLLFLDADDYFTEEAFDVFDAELNTDCDIVYFNATSIVLKTGEVSDRHHTIDAKIKKAINEGNEDVLRYHFTNPVCKMVRREMVEKYALQYQEVPASNDLIFSVKTGHYAQKVKAVNKVVYVITTGDAGTSLTKTHSLRNEEARFRVLVDWYLFLKEVGRLDMSPRIVGFINKGYKLFGIRTAIRWFLYAIRHKVNIFRGL